MTTVAVMAEDMRLNRGNADEVIAGYEQREIANLVYEGLADIPYRMQVRFLRRAYESCAAVCVWDAGPNGVTGGFGEASAGQLLDAVRARIVAGSSLDDAPDDSMRLWLAPLLDNDDRLVVCCFWKERGWETLRLSRAWLSPPRQGDGER